MGVGGDVVQFSSLMRQTNFSTFIAEIKFHAKMPFWQVWNWWTNDNIHKQKAKKGKLSNLQIQDIICKKNQNKKLNQARLKGWERKNIALGLKIYTQNIQTSQMK